MSFVFLVLALLGLASSAQAAKGVIGEFGSPGSEGGQFNSPTGVAVNSTGAGGVNSGDVYVVDTGNNRIQRFS